MRYSLIVLVACGAPAVNSPAPTQLTSAQVARDNARVPLAERVTDAYSNTPSSDEGLVARWSPDGSQIVFASQRDGLTELYAGDPAHPEAPPRPLTPGTERAPVGQFTHDGKAILFLRDTGADENFAIYRSDTANGETVNLTVDGPKLHRSEPILPLHRDDIMVYAAASQTDPTTMLFVQPVLGGPAKIVYKQAVPGGLIDVSADASRALMAEFHADDDIVLSEVDVATGHARRVFPAEGTHAAMSSAGYAPDGKTLYVAGDRGDGSMLVALDTETLAERATYRDAIRTSPLTFLVSPTGDTIALGVDAGTHNLVRVLDAKTLVSRGDVATPLGEILLGSYRPDGGAFSIAISQPAKPDDPYVVDVATRAVVPLRSDPRAGVSELPVLDVKIEHATAFDGLDLPLVVYLPPHREGARLPVIAWFHGGPSASSPAHWAPSLRFFTALGYAIVEPNVRGSTGFGKSFEMADNREHRADWLRDLHTVNEWLRAQPWVAPDRIAIRGGSYGGSTTLMALTRFPTEWRAGIDAFGPANLKTFLLTTDAAIRSGFIPEFGDVDKDAALIDEFSPMRDIDKIARPLFVYAGQNDPRVPRSESDALVSALRKRHVPVEYMVAPNEGHSVDRRESKIALMVRMARFLEDAFATN
jgi:dipeptidyl aminopeptidase/acylaminoacyl peptidase